MLILVGIAFVAIFADVLAPYDPEIGALAARFRPPAWQVGGSGEHLLGTDHLGRDVLSRLIFGARVSMVVGFTAVIFAGVIGTVLGIVSGYLGGWVDQVIMRITDTWLALPALTFAIFLTAIVGPSEMNIVIILGRSTGRATRASFAARCFRSRSGSSCSWPSWRDAPSGRSCAATSCPTSSTRPSCSAR